MKRILILTLAIFATAAHAKDLSDLPATAGGHAHAELRHADRKDGTLTVEVRFLTDYEGYSGETLYETPEGVHVEANGTSYPLVSAPESFELKFNYDPARNPRVGEWEAEFEAPPADVTEAVLIIPNVDPIPLRIRDR